jgi:hypothetical protein
MASRRAFLTALAGAAVASPLTACSRERSLSPWRGARQFAVESVDGEVFLLALDEQRWTWAPAAPLGDLKISATANVSLVVQDSSSGPVVLTWANGDGLTHAARIDSSSQQVQDLQYAVDSGASGLVGGRLFSLLPASAGDAAQVAPLTARPSTSRHALPFFPAVVAQAGDGLVLTGRASSGTLVTRVDGNVVADRVRSVALPGAPLDAAVLGPDTALTAGTVTPQDRPGLYLVDATGRVRQVPGVAKPRLIAAPAADRLVVDDASNGERFVRLVRLSGGAGVTASARLDSSDPVRDLRALRSGRVVVVQQDRISVLTPDLTATQATYTSKGTILSDR